MSNYLINRTCIPIKGYNRSIIYDLIRKDYLFISNDVFSRINTNKPFNLDNLDTNFKELLLKNEIIFEVYDFNKNNFPNIKLNFKSPYNIEVLIIDYDLIDFNSIFSFSNKNINNLTLIFEKYYETEDLYSNIKAILEIIHVESLNIIFINNEQFDKIDLSKLIFIDELFEIFVYSSEEDSIIAQFNFQINKFKCKFHEYIRNVYSNRFSINNYTFLMSCNGNAYYFKKIFLGKNSILSLDYNQTYKIENIDYIKKYDYIFVSKDKINICNKCEFRHMCLDPRIPFLKNDKIFFKEECNYNPYISKWKDEIGYKNLKDSGVEISENGEVIIDKKKLKKSFEEAWID